MINYPEGFKPSNVDDNIELYLINTLTPRQLFLFRYLMLITNNGTKSICIKLKVISNQTRIKRTGIQSIISHFEYLNIIVRERMGREGIEIQFNPKTKWMQREKNKRDNFPLPRS